MIALNTPGTEGMVNLMTRVKPCPVCGEKASVIIDGDGFMVTVLISCRKCRRRLVKWFVEDGKKETTLNGVTNAIQEWNSGKGADNVL